MNASVALRSVLVLLAFGSPGVSGQALAVADCRASDGGSVVGSFVVEHPQIERKSRAVQITRDGRPVCLASSRVDGSFEFTNLAPGRYTLEPSQPRGLSVSDAVDIEVEAGGELQVEIRVGFEDAVADCVKDSTWCAEVMDAEAPDSLAPEEQEAFRYYQAGLALAGVVEPILGSSAVCLSPNPSPALVAALSVLHETLAPSNECAPDSQSAGRVVHVLSGQPAVQVGFQVLNAGARSALWVGYRWGPTNARSYQCALEEGSEGREVGPCSTSMATPTQN